MPFDVVGVKLDLDAAAVRRLGDAVAGDMLEAAGFILVADIKNSFSGGGGEYSEPASGETYYRGVNNDIEHVASAPGQPPAVDTGRLRASIDSVRPSGEPRVLIGTPFDYAAYMEFGTKRIKPRPFFRPAVYRYYGNNNLALKAARWLKARGRLR